MRRPTTTRTKPDDARAVVARTNAATAKHVAQRVARLHVLKRKIAEAYDAALLAAAANKVSAATIGHEILVAEGRPQTEKSLTRVEWNVRKALSRARAGKFRHASGVAAHGDKREAGDVLRLRKRVIEYYADDQAGPDDDIAHEDHELDSLDVEDLNDVHELDRDERDLYAAPAGLAGADVSPSPEER